MDFLIADATLERNVCDLVVLHSPPWGQPRRAVPEPEELRRPPVQTRVTQLLDELGVPHQLQPHAVEAYSAEAVAHYRGVRISQVVKCMVGTTGSEYVVMLIPGDRRLKSSKARRHLGAEQLALAPVEELTNALGLIVGAIAPLHLLGSARMLMDPSVLAEEFVDISSGDPLAGVKLRSTDLRDAVQAELVAMTSIEKPALN
jgi:prolyl-tRNA editing enzyme YbaK/EbsC (Cys-tRNA(Pro) deacylase)